MFGIAHFLNDLQVIAQINGTLNIIGNFLEKVPGMDSLASFAKTFVDIALGNVDECCMAYTFYYEDQSAFKSAADGVVIYFQNWKTILKDALKTAVIVSGIAWFCFMFVIIGILSAMGMPGIMGLAAALLLAMMIIIVVKSAVMDSYTMICMVCSYLRVAPTTEITFDLYNKLCKLSSKFKSLLQKAGEAI